MKRLFKKLTKCCNHQFVRKFEIKEVNGKPTNECFLICQCIFCNKVNRVDKVTFTSYGALIEACGTKWSVDKEGNEINK